MKLPNDTNAEINILSAILINPDSLSNVDGFLKPEHFYSPKNKMVYESIISLSKEGSAVDLVTLSADLRDKKVYDNVGASYISEIIEKVGTAANIKSYADIITEKAKARDVHKLSEMMDKWIAANKDPDEMLNAISVSVSRIEMKYFKAKKEDSDSSKIYTWGTRYLDQHVTSIKPHKHVVLVGETGSGKTTFCFDMAIKNAHEGKRVMFISLEMPKEEIYKVKSEDYAGITPDEYRLNEWSDEKEEKRKERYDYLKGLDNLNLVGWSGEGKMDIDKILSFISNSNHKDLVFIDNLDLIECAGSGNDLQRVEKISKKFMNFSKDNNIPTILLHHFKKSSGGSSARGIDSVRGSAKITHNAHIVLKVERIEGDMPMDKATLVVMMMKDRRFGRASVSSVYWGNGTFLDQNEWLAECTAYGKYTIDK